MNVYVVTWLEMLLIALADARATLVSFGADEPELAASIDAALAEARALSSGYFGRNHA